ncbi:MAG: hypothetical protein HGA41_09455 [Syntrophaceae bacterium]|nr:hypothetical protein [Syntrophaceae bacterium]
MESKLTLQSRTWPMYGWVGIAFTIIFWITNWSLSGFRTHWGFFPMWLGYCLTVDALVFSRKGHSLLTRNPRAYVSLFFVSAPAWWLFEVINWRTQNWYYVGEQNLTTIEYFLFSSLSFSTVMPAVFGTAELAGTFSWIRRIKPGPRIAYNTFTLISLFTTGCIMLTLMFVWPRYFFPFVWLSVYFIVEPLNVRLRHRTLLEYVAESDWRPVLALWVGCLICGFFWEMWNFYSYPKWIYRIPFFDFLHIFEMPALGFLGYVPFSMELFALYHMTVGLCKPGMTQNYVRIIP